MKISPLQDWVLLRPLTVGDKSPGGIVIPDSAKEKPTRGEVVAAGPGRYEEEGDRKGKVTADRKFVKTEVRPGDKVLYRRFGVDEIDVEGETLLLIRESDILGLL
jgi:chaperonin GroES